MNGRGERKSKGKTDTGVGPGGGVRRGLVDAGRSLLKSISNHAFTIHALVTQRKLSIYPLQCDQFSLVPILARIAKNSSFKILTR